MKRSDTQRSIVPFSVAEQPTKQILCILEILVFVARVGGCTKQAGITPLHQQRIWGTVRPSPTEIVLCSAKDETKMPNAYPMGSSSVVERPTNEFCFGFCGFVGRMGGCTKLAGITLLHQCKSWRTMRPSPTEIVLCSAKDETKMPNASSDQPNEFLREIVFLDGTQH